MCNCNKEKCSCNKKQSICKKETCTTSCCTTSIDAKSVFYKTSGDCYSKLDFLAVPKGADLEYILERIGYFIENTNYIDVEGNPYGATNFTEYIAALRTDLNTIRNCCTTANQEIGKLKDEISLIKSRLDNLEYPKVMDVNGLGFTQNDTQKKVLQTLADNTRKINV